MWMYIKRLNITKKSKILHIAPEKGIYDALYKVAGKKNYITADLKPDLYKFTKNCIRMDLCDLDNQDSYHYDLIIHSHVLEHTPCNIAYTLYHLHRILKKDGVHVCIIPFMPGRYDECFQNITGEERRQRFGQHDHVRKFGNEDIDSHLGKLLHLPDHFDATDSFSEDELREANIPEHFWKGFNASTVLILKRDDMKFLSIK